MKFGEALELLREGQRIARTAWNSQPQGTRWICLVEGEEWATDDGGAPVRAARGMVTRCLPWIGLRLPSGAFGPWSPTHTDLLADDWKAVETYYDRVAPGSDKPVPVRSGDYVERIDAEARAMLGSGRVTGIVDDRILEVRWTRREVIAPIDKREICLMRG